VVDVGAVDLSGTVVDGLDDVSDSSSTDPTTVALTSRAPASTTKMSTSTWAAH